MPDTGAPWNIPYVESTDLVSDWPADSLALANAIDAGLDNAGNAGIGSNVVQTVKTDTFTTTTSGWQTITDLEVTITPTTATSKILIVADVTGGTNNAGGSTFLLRFAGGNSSAYVGDAASNRTRAATGFRQGNTASGGYTANYSMFYVDAPATTSPVTYSVEVFRDAGTVQVNRSDNDSDSDDFGRFASSITAIEVAA